MKINFYDEVSDELLKFAVVVSKADGKWVMCKHKQRDTLEVPGGTREKGEAILETAKRELYEETGALEYTIEPVCVYSVDDGKAENFGMLYYAEIASLGVLPDSEIEKVYFLDVLPDNWTYPHIQPQLIKKICEKYNWGNKNDTV